MARVILDMRLARGLNQEDLAHAAGLSVAAYARIERGKSNPTWMTVRAIADALDLGLAELGQRVTDAAN